MPSELSLEELLFELKRAFDTAIDCGLPKDVPDVRQAYTQIKSLLSQKEIETEENIVIKMPPKKKYKLKVQKEVSEEELEEFVEKWLYKILEDIEKARKCEYEESRYECEKEWTQYNLNKLLKEYESMRRG